MCCRGGRRRTSKVTRGRARGCRIANEWCAFRKCSIQRRLDVRRLGVDKARTGRYHRCGCREDHLHDGFCNSTSLRGGVRLTSVVIIDGEHQVPPRGRVPSPLGKVALDLGASLVAEGAYVASERGCGRAVRSPDGVYLCGEENGERVLGLVLCAACWELNGGDRLYPVKGKASRYALRRRRELEGGR